MKNNNTIKSLLIFGIVSSLSFPSPSQSANTTPSPPATSQLSVDGKSDSLEPLVKTLNKNTQYLERLKDIDLKKMQADQATTNNLMLWIAITLTIFVILKVIEIGFSWKQTQMQNKYLEFLEQLLANLKEDFEKILNIPEKIDTLSSKLNTNLENITERLERLETKPSDALPQKLTEIESDLTQIKDNLNKPKDINTQDFARQLIEAIKSNPDLIVAIAAAVSSQQGGESKSSFEPPKFPEEVPSLESSDPLVLTKEEKQVVKCYNDGADLPSIEDVSPTQDTVEEARTGREQIAYLKPDQLGMYWIIRGKDGTYLVPNRNRKPNTHQMNSVQDLFDCHNYQAGTTDPKNFQLVKPGKVASETTGETSVLQSKGILEFQ